jgi:hypothetical protein
MGFTVAIVGRPNVGKSTFFNRLLEERKAIVDDFSGVTRDRQYGESDWNGKKFNVIDNGRFVADSKNMPMPWFLWWMLRKVSPLWTRPWWSYCATAPNLFC